MKFYKYLAFVALACSSFACTSLTDCQCMIMEDDNKQPVIHEEYDYEGSCSELETDDAVSCTAK